MTEHLHSRYDPNCYRCELGVGELEPPTDQWWCPSCNYVLRRTPFLINDRRYHSWHCSIPMQPVQVKRPNQAHP